MGRRARRERCEGGGGDEGNGWPYGHPGVYDALHARGTAGEVDGLERIAARFVGARRGGGGARGLRWLEPACGTGRYLRVLARRGARCVGVDRSAAMVGYARGRMKGMQRPARVVVGDMREIDEGMIGGRVDVAFCLHNSVRHLRSDREVREHLRAVAGVLRPGGAYLVGVSLFRAGELMPSESVTEAQRGGMRVVEVVSCEPVVRGEDGEGVERVTSVAVVRRGLGEEEVLTGSYELWCGDVARWGRIVRAAGMLEVAVGDERGAELERGRAGYGIRVLVKQGSSRPDSRLPSRR